ncbi:hypothetical protein NC651_023507 [Populus alba x Populus x berolinensis]|nr:hypothetical protein NC651_023507 [Populus alba x Populus x berolinensis]
MLRFQSKLCHQPRQSLWAHNNSHPPVKDSSHANVFTQQGFRNHNANLSIKRLTMTLLQRKLSRRGSYNHAICNGNVLKPRWKPCSNSNALQSRWKLKQFTTVMLSNQDGNSAEAVGA